MGDFAMHMHDMDAPPASFFAADKAASRSRSRSRRQDHDSPSHAHVQK